MLRADVSARATSPWRWSENPCGTFSVVQSLYSEPGVMRVGGTQDDVAGKRVLLQHVIEGRVDASPAGPSRPRARRPPDSSRAKSGGPGGSFRRAASRRSAPSRPRRGTPERRAISSNGSRTKPSILSSEIARIFSLIGSLCSTGNMQDLIKPASAALVQQTVVNRPRNQLADPSRSD